MVNCARCRRNVWEKLVQIKWVIIGLLGKGLVSSGLKFLALSLARIPALNAFAGAHQNENLAQVLLSLHLRWYWCAAAVLLGIVGMLNDTTQPDAPDPTKIPHKPRRLDPTATGHVVSESTIPVPSSWDHTDPHDVSCHIVDVTDTSIRDEIEAGIRATAHESCHDRRLHKSAHVVKVERIENMALWKQYWHRKHEMSDVHSAHGIRPKRLQPIPPRLGSYRCLDPEKLVDVSLNEVFLYHGTTQEVAQIVSK
eukprot:COSAG02_NODE_3129_length_7312_cov_338.294191_9_plen_253_part_00